MIDQYPKFSKLNLSQSGEIAAFTARFEPFSDFNFTSLFAWDTAASTEVAYLNGNLVIRMPDYIDGHVFYSILGDNDIENSVETLIKDTGKLELVPEVVVQALTDKSKYHIAEDRDGFDYVYDLDHLSELPGNKFKKKRNKTNVFVKDHTDFEVVVKVSRSVDPGLAAKLKRVDMEWVAQNPRQQGDILAERKALARLLDNAAAFKLHVVEILVDGEIKGFGINEIIANGYAICHFEKALNVHHQHLNTFLAIEGARKLKEAGCRLANWEQDLGLEGLRRAKSSYHPVKMLKKYTISLGNQVSTDDHSAQ